MAYLTGLDRKTKLRNLNRTSTATPPELHGTVVYAAPGTFPRRKEVAEMQILKQSWWAPVAGVLVLAQLGVALAFLFGEGTFNLLDAESTTAGLLLSFGGASALAVGLWSRRETRGLGNTLVIVGAALAAIWFWIIFMTPLAIVVIVGVVSSQVRSAAPAARTP